MRPAYDVPTIYAAEAAMMTEVPEGELMSRAARGLARIILDVPQPARIAGARVVLLIGSGNNGGDALFAGAALARRGAQVDAITLGDSFHDRGARALRGAGGHVRDHTSPAAEGLVAAADIVVDGIVGIGAQGALRPDAARLVTLIPATAWVVAVDIPSGVDPNTGVVADPSAVVTADITVTFGALKAGQLLPPGRERCGILELVDIGLGPYVAGRAPTFAVLSLTDAAPFFAPPGESDYKYSHGVPGVWAGSAQYPGAAHMVVGAARHGAVGMVRLWQDPAPAVAAAVVTRYPDVVVTSGPVAQDPKVTAWIAGPGIGTGPSEVRRLAAVLATELPAVIDADALTLVSDHDELRTAIRQRSAPTVVTPHVAEFTRLGFALDHDRVRSARVAAEELQAIVLLKGAGTVIAAPGGQTYVDVMGPAALATAGTGDALSGLIGAALSRHPDDVARAVAAAVVVHGVAARKASAGGRPMTAWDLVQYIPDAVAALRGDND